MNGSGDETRKRELTVLVAVGVVVLFIVVVTALTPVGASFRGDESYNCGTAFRRWRHPSALKREWTTDTATIEKAYPETKVSGKTPLAVCPDRVDSRLRLVKVVGVLASLLIAASLGVYWYRYGFINDPHV